MYPASRIKTGCPHGPDGGSIWTYYWKIKHFWKHFHVDRPYYMFNIKIRRLFWWTNSLFVYEKVFLLRIQQDQINLLSTSLISNTQHFIWKERKGKEKEKVFSCHWLALGSLLKLSYAMMKRNIVFLWLWCPTKTAESAVCHQWEQCWHKQQTKATSDWQKVPDVSKLASTSALSFASDCCQIGQVPFHTHHYAHTHTRIHTRIVTTAFVHMSTIVTANRKVKWKWTSGMIRLQEKYNMPRGSGFDLICCLYQMIETWEDNIKIAKMGYECVVSSMTR